MTEPTDDRTTDDTEDRMTDPTDAHADDRTTDHTEDRATDHADDRSLTVEIPERTATAISRRIRGTAFDSVEEYVAFALGQLLRELDRQDDGDGPSAAPGPDDETAGDDPDDDATDEAVAERLESLGYL